jgi:DNA ligase-1
MLFSELAVYFQRLEHTSARNALVEILAELFHKAPPDQIAPTTYLLQGRLAPFFVPVEIGMGVNYVADAIARAYNADRPAVLHRFDRVGDIGEAARELAGESGLAPEPQDTPGVREVFDRLNEIASTTGEGSVERKVGMLAALLARLDPLSANYLCRIPVGRLRLGVGDPTILDGYSYAQVGDKSLRKRLERAYNETSDLGLIGTTLWTGGVEAVEELGITVGNPVRPALAERLPSAEAIIAKLGACSVEKKYDGFRCQVHKLGDDVKIYSRNLEDMTGMFPEIAEGAVRQIGVHSAIFEGEAIAYNPLSEEYLPFQETTKRRRKHKIADTAQELPLRLFAFDLLYADGENVTPLPYSERHRRLGALIRPDETILLSENRVVDEPQQLLEIFSEAVQGGLEGVMAKKLDAPYRAGGRNYNWVKLKRAQAGDLQDTVDCVIIGYIYGRGKRSAFGVGALLVGVYDPERDLFPSITKIGTGLTDTEWREVRERCEPFVREEKPARVESLLTPSVWVEPAVVIEVLADEITRSPVHSAGMNGQKQGYALRFPRLISFRDADKRPEDSTTVAEIVSMYGQQGAKPVPA